MNALGVTAEAIRILWGLAGRAWAFSRGVRQDEDGSSRVNPDPAALKDYRRTHEGATITSPSVHAATSRHARRRATHRVGEPVQRRGAGGPALPVQMRLSGADLLDKH